MSIFCRIKTNNTTAFEKIATMANKIFPCGCFVNPLLVSKSLFEFASNILLLDDFLVQSNEHQMQIINSIYSTYRHLNVCVISTIHSYHKKFLTILEQSGLVISMYGFAQVSFLRNIMKSKIFKGTADIIREIQKLFRTRMKAHSYISLNFSKEAICSEKFFVTDSVFRPDHGIVLKQILEKM